MGRPSALLIMGGADYHNTAAHYELLGRAAGRPRRLQRHGHGRLPGPDGGVPLPLRPAGALGYLRRTPRTEPVHAALRAVRRGTPLLIQHGALYTVRSRSKAGRRPWAPYIMRSPVHLPYQEIRSTSWTARILSPPGCRTFVTADELFTPGAAGTGRDAAGQLRRPRRGQAVHAPGQARPRARRRARLAPGAAQAPLVYVKAPGRRHRLRQRPGARRQRHRQPRLPPAHHPGGALAHRRRPRLTRRSRPAPPRSPGCQVRWPAARAVRRPKSGLDGARPGRGSATPTCGARPTTTSPPPSSGSTPTSRWSRSRAGGT